MKSTDDVFGRTAETFVPFQLFDGYIFTTCVYFVTLTFVGVDSEEQFQMKIKELAESNGVALSEEVFEKVVPLVMEFITWLKVL